jgi:hypothetical protein
MMHVDGDHFIVAHVVSTDTIFRWYDREEAAEDSGDGRQREGLPSV